MYWVMSRLPTLKGDILTTLLRCLLIQQTALPVCWAPLTGKIPWSMACWTIRLFRPVLTAVYQPQELSLPSVWPCLSLLSDWLPSPWSPPWDCLSKEQQRFYQLYFRLGCATTQTWFNHYTKVVNGLWYRILMSYFLTSGLHLIPHLVVCLFFDSFEYIHRNPQ